MYVNWWWLTDITYGGVVYSQYVNIVLSKKALRQKFQVQKKEIS